MSAEIIAETQRRIELKSLESLDFLNDGVVIYSVESSEDKDLHLSITHNESTPSERDPASHMSHRVREDYYCSDGQKPELIIVSSTESDRFQASPENRRFKNLLKTTVMCPATKSK